MVTPDNPPSSRFRTAGPYYVRFRPRYPAALIEGLVRSCGLDGSGRLLDLGCGPGFLAIALAPHVEEAVGMDPEPEMLSLAAEEADAAGVRLSLIQGGSGDLGPQLGRFRLVTMGRSFHWMERDATLAALDRLVVPGGAVAILGEHHVEAPDNDWRTVWETVSRKWTGSAGGARARRRDPGWEPHDSVLRRSAFSQVERLTVAESRTTGLEALVGRAYSMSASTPAALGDRRTAFEADLRQALAPFLRDGAITEDVEFEAFLAHRA
jgi:SAM-dependent methyltransferase